MPERVITMTKEVIKDIKSGRQGARETRKKPDRVERRNRGKKEKKNQ